MSRDLAVEDRIRALPCWRGPISFEPLPGGLTNQNRLVRCLGEGFVVRLGADSAAHSIDRGIEARISAAAARIGLAPELIHAGGGFLVLRHIEGRTLAAEDLASAHNLGRAIHLLRRCRDDMPAACNFPLPDRAPIRILARYLEVLAAPAQRWHDSPMRLAPRVAALTRRLESRSLGFAHNDIHAGNLIDDGVRLWLIDWEYAGAGDPLVDLASLINNGGVAQADISDAAALWCGAAADSIDSASLADLRLAAALRDLFWGYVQDGLSGGLDEYIAINDARVDKCAGLAGL